MFTLWAKVQPNQVTYTCPVCSGNLDSHFSWEEDPTEVDQNSILGSRESSLWRYAPLLAVPDPGFQASPLHRVGFTPVYQPENLRQKLGLRSLYVKDESPNPSASFKDRASAIVISRAIEAGIDTTIAASTGNAGAAMACMAASVGKRAIILAPKSAPPAKIAQLLTFGAEVILVDGSYDDAFDLSIEASNEFGWYNRNTGYNPYTVEGKRPPVWKFGNKFCAFSFSSRGQHFHPGWRRQYSFGRCQRFHDLLALGWIENYRELSVFKLKVLPQSAMPFSPRATKSKRFMLRRWQTASASTCRVTACVL